MASELTLQPDARLDDLVDRIRPTAASSLLLWTIVGFTLLFLVWAGLATLDRVVRGQGRVVPSSQLQTVANLEGGVVKGILVRQGQRVTKGTPLVRLDPVQMGADYGRAESEADARDARIARLEAEVAGRAPAYSDELKARAGDFIASEQALHASRMTDLGGLQSAARARLVQAERATAEARATADARRAAVRAADSEVQMIRPLVTRGIEPRLSLVEAENRLAIASSELAAAEAAALRAQSGIGEARAVLNQQSGEWRARAAEALATARAEAAAQRRTRPALADRLDRTTLRAPMDGIVNRVLVSTVGGAVRAGEPLVEIVPSGEAMVVQAKVKPADIAHVRIDQPAVVKITAYDYAIFGGMKGKVASISPDVVVDERTGESHYDVRVETEARTFSDRRTGQPLQIGPGMMAEVDILGAKRSILSYLLTPITRIRDDALRE
jgi:adhesin transport system membrane fusion protein